MALAIISKNSFITFAETPNLQPRSRSADVARSRPEAEELNEQTQQSLHRLTAAMNDGCVLQPLPPSKSSSPRTVSLSEALDSIPTLTLQMPAEPWDKSLRNPSSMSLSTLAPDDASDYGSPGPANRIRPVFSSGSLCSMVSDRWGDLEEEQGMEFDLDIEAGAEAACEKKAAVEVPALPVLLQGKVTQAAVEVPALGKITQEMSHSLVPKNQNMAEIYKKTGKEAPTTLMIRNIPGKYSQNDLMMDLKDTGFGSSYDFLYLPIDKGTASNVGYAFVNFMDPAVATRCIKSFEGHRFNRHQRTSTKLASISVAHLQGLEKNLQHYENCAVNASKEKKRRPVIVANLSSMFA